MAETFDIAIVGAGITGCAIARQLARFDLSICVVEAANDIALGASKANGGLVHAGYDPAPGTVKAQVNARGCELYGTWAQELGFLFRRTGSMVLGFNDEDRAHLEKLRSNGLANGVPELSIIGPERIHELEPRASAKATCALWCPSTGFVDPFEVAIAALENAVANGVTFMRSAPVEAIEVAGGEATDRAARFTLVTPAGDVRCRYLINAAGNGAADISHMAGAEEFQMVWRQGNIVVLDKEPRALMPLYPVPTPVSKGVIVTGTVHGNTVITATAAVREPGDTQTYASDVNALLTGARKLVPDLDTRRVVRAFAGGRPVIKGTNDFFIGQSAVVPGLFQAAGIQSPGVASAPAIAERMEHVMREAGVALRERADWDPIRRAPDDFDRAPLARKEELIESDPAWGQIVCRCETVPEAEIVAAIRRRPGAVSLEGVKRRCRAGMGRCQSGFCQSRVVAILARELGCDPSEVLLEDTGSWLVEGPLKGCARMAEFKSSAIASDAVEAVPTLTFDVIAIGGGPAGMASALAAHKAGARVAIVEREQHLGGILRQCIHPGFGLSHFKQELTGPEYAQRFIDQVCATDIALFLDSMVLGIDSGEGAGAGDPGTDESMEDAAVHTVTLMSPTGMLQLTGRAVVLAMGCRERTRSEIKIPGSRPAGVFTAGLAQRYINIENLKPGSRAVILGSGDIGLIMARRCTLEGISVEGVYELMPYANGLRRNVKNCLDDFGIPLYLSTTVTRVIGHDRVEAVEVSQVDEHLAPIPGTERVVPCDTLLLSVGLIPENELSVAVGVELDPRTRGAVVDQSLQTGVPGIFACGNVLHVHDLADNVTTESERAGTAAAAYALGGSANVEPDTAGPGCQLTVSPAGIAGYALPGRITAVALTKHNFRVRRPVDAARVRILAGDEELFAGKVRPFKPSVMESFPLPAKVIQRALDMGVSEIVLSVDPAEEA